MDYYFLAFLDLEPQVCERSLEVKSFFRVRPCVRHKKILVVFGMNLKIRMEIWVYYKRMTLQNRMGI